MSEDTFAPREVGSSREAAITDCPNGPDEDGNWPCDPQGYFGWLECQVCGREGRAADA